MSYTIRSEKREINRNIKGINTKKDNSKKGFSLIMYSLFIQ